MPGPSVLPAFEACRASTVLAQCPAILDVLFVRYGPLSAPLARMVAMVKRFPTQPAHPERTCWGCERYCAATSMACGNGSERTQHPAELFGPDWQEWAPPSAAATAPVSHPPARDAA